FSSSCSGNVIAPPRLQRGSAPSAEQRSQHAQKVAVLGAEDSSVRLLEELVFGNEEQLLDQLGQSWFSPGSVLVQSWFSPGSCVFRVDLTHRFRRDLVKGGESSLSKSDLQQRMKERSEVTHGRGRRSHTSEFINSISRPWGYPGSNLVLLQMKKCLDANSARGSSDSLTSVQFHPNAQVVMTTGIDQSLSLFQVDGQLNPLVQSIFLENFPVFKARFSSDGLTVIATSFKNKLFYLYHMMEGKVTPVSGVRGLNEARVKEFSVCPVGDAVLLTGTRGYLHLLSLKTNEIVRSLKLNGDVSSVAFSFDGDRVFSSSEEGEVFVWDLRSSRCLNRFTDDGCVKSTSISTSPNGRYLACGSQSGVVNIYSLDSCVSSSQPKPLKSIMNLVTPTTTLRFNPTSELLALGSRADDEAVRLLHVPSLTVFSNFPVSKRKICHKVQDMAFSPHSGFFCLATNKGRAPLYRLLHYKDF
uniref:U3 small nucleolar RNA-associated protein 18 homolog n=1 Tax=Periophthalmus magnuspinnatus TaxID=409849 RepID=A0A3B3Z942_9GOBI